VPAPYSPDGRHGRRIRTKHTNTNKTQLYLATIIIFYS
jgi:hypothetical protein